MDQLLLDERENENKPKKIKPKKKMDKKNW